MPSVVTWERKEGLDFLPLPLETQWKFKGGNSKRKKNGYVIRQKCIRHAAYSNISRKKNRFFFSLYPNCIRPSIHIRFRQPVGKKFYLNIVRQKVKDYVRAVTQLNWLVLKIPFLNPCLTKKKTFPSYPEKKKSMHLNVGCRTRARVHWPRSLMCVCCINRCCLGRALCGRFF